MLFSMIFYVIGAFVIASILTVVVLMLKPAHLKSDSKSWVKFLWFFGLTLALPYGFTEYLTRTNKGKMDKVVKEAYETSGVDGPLQYFKVVWLAGGHAKVFAVGKEKQDWGGDDYPVIQVNLVQEGGEWKADSYKSIYWPRKNKDGIVFPPYW